MPSLVKKWQSIQKELDEEEKSSSSDEDRDQLNKKSIEEWKQQQLMTYVFSLRFVVTFSLSSHWNFLFVYIFFYSRGRASKNANFEALPDDWRERLKKRKMNSTWCHPTSTKLIFYSPHSLLLLCQYTAVQFLMICKQSHAHVETFKVPDMIGHSSRGLECHFVFFLLFFR